MFLHIGNGVNVRRREIVGIFDLDTATMGADTRDFLKIAEGKGILSDCANGEIPRSFVLSSYPGGAESVRLSLISSGGLRARAETGERWQRESDEEL